MGALGKKALRPCTLHAVGYLALAGLLAGWTAALTLEACEGELIPPLDDTYIYLQYAQAAALGNPLEYQPGMEPTRGATSLLYPLILAPGARAIPRESLFWLAWVWGVLSLAGSAWAADRWMARVSGPGAAWGAGLLVLVSGHFLWGSMSGMDIGLYALCLTMALAAVPWYFAAPDPATGVRRLTGLSGLLFLLSLARPEGTLLALVIAGGVPLAGRAPNSVRARWILILAPLTGALATFGVNILALGSASPNTLAAKAVFSEPRPDVQAQLLQNLPWVFGQITEALFSDFRSSSFGYGTGFVLKGFLMLGAVSGVGLGWRHRGSRPAVYILAAVLLAALLTGLIPAGYNSHHHRYQIPYIPAASLLVLFGWWSVIAKRGPRFWRVAPLLTIIVLMLPGLWRFGHMVSRNASNILDHQVSMGRWIDENLPQEAVVALNDAGAIAYYGRRPVLDLVGLVTNGSALPNRAGPGSLFEWLETLPLEQRPTHFAIFPDWFPYLKKTTLVGTKLTQFTLGENTISGADTKSLYVANWKHVETEDLPWVRRELITMWDFTVVDALDVGDLTSQAAHDYESFDTWRDTLREFGMAGAPEHLAIDGGRLSSHGERFRMKSRPGEPAALIMRTEAFREFSLRVLVDGKEVGRWEIPRAPVTWTEPLFQIPGDALTGDSVLIELFHTETQTRYPSFHYWMLQ